MNIFNWLQGLFSKRSKALSRYTRGMARAKKHDREGAIADYTTTILSSDTPVEVKAMALYYRALVYVATGDDRKGLDDLDAVMAMEESLINIKTMARQKLARMESRLRKNAV